MNNLLSEYFGSAERQYIPDMLSIVGGVETSNEAFETFMRIGGDGLLEEHPVEIYGKGERSQHIGASTVDYDEFILPEPTGGLDEDDTTLDINSEIVGSFEQHYTPSNNREAYHEEIEEFINNSGIFDV